MKPSDQLYEKALRLIPWGTQTNAKRPIPFFGETQPKFIERGKGCRLWDMEGKEYIDFRLALGPVTLGYCYDEVDDAVRAQMQKGVLFSMASPLEAELAELITQIVPNAEMCRFMKTGEDANLSNIRIARAATKREMILMSGYHGYPDWFATEDSPNNGVPEFMKDYVKVIPWGDCEEAERLVKLYGDRIACIIATPYDFNSTDTSGAYIRMLRALTREHGILLVMDEVLTGFRLALGGAQEFFGVDADLASYAKAVANGYPLSTYVGKREYMQSLDRFKMTTTYAGETLSIAAAIATLTIMKREPVHEHIGTMGRLLMSRFDEIARECGVEGKAAGLPCGSWLLFATPDAAYNARLDYLWQRELYREGVFTNSRWFISYSHRQSDIDEAAEKARTALRRALDCEVKERGSVTPFYY
ncbi:MAG: aspartate aminotransferase family protein [Acidobacteriota bacterium]